ncbi:DNA-processing protein DprA [Dyella japonica]|uniref:DNA processing protein DprA n=1 Tax=Dyella japonica A8 TaxID=1217721 RepID=A0A075JY06_9GAMM|nr:DNA-processing protein DprA [Dyella japonica]AIF46470.1 DNA processing protein DprA [Dyella japonica A8]
MDETAHLRTWLTLLRTPRLGPAALREQLDACGGRVDAVLDALRQRLSSLPDDTRRWLERPDERRLDDDLTWLEPPGRRLMLCTDEDFPPLLEAIAQPPAALFVTGDASLLLHPQLAIVGARGATLSGRAHARAFAQALGLAGFTITSGMADGVDGAAHVAALDAGLPTVAVVGTGPDRVYPARHHALARRLAAEGVLVSEFPPGTPARSDHFPRRNRLIAGLSLGTLVVEAGLQSGSLITARLAAEQGREVFALPGSIHNPLAHGCHRLIRDGARLVETAAEIVEVLAPAAVALGRELAVRLDGAAVSPHVETASEVDPSLQALLDALGHGLVALEDLAAFTGQAVAGLSSALLLLELEGRVESLPGNRYQRLPG